MSAVRQPFQGTLGYSLTGKLLPAPVPQDRPVVNQDELARVQRMLVALGVHHEASPPTLRLVASHG